MNLSRKNLDQLKQILEQKNKSTKEYNSKKISNNDNENLSNLDSLDFDNPNEIFYSIIDNSNYLEDTTLHNQKLKESEEKLLNIKKSIISTNQNSNSKIKLNNKLSEEDLLYDEFNYLLHE